MEDRAVEWFEVEVEGAGHEAFVTALRASAASWPPSARTSPANTGGWVQDGFVITYADVNDTEANVIVNSFRVDFDGTRALAARVTPSHVDQGSLFGSDRPEGLEPVELSGTGPDECAAAAATWYRRRLVPSKVRGA